MSTNVTQILLDIASNRLPSEDGLALIYPAVYQELRRLARRHMRDQPDGHTLTPTALVHEAYLKLVHHAELRSETRRQFFAVASKAMRSVLVDHSRRRAAAKRGGGWQRITLTDHVATEGREIEILELHRALLDLASKDSRMAHVVEMRVFGGLSVDETADVLGVAARTVDNDWKVAKIWLADRMQSGSV